MQKTFTNENASENVVCEIVAILSREAGVTWYVNGSILFCVYILSTYFGEYWLCHNEAILLLFDHGCTFAWLCIDVGNDIKVAT